MARFPRQTMLDIRVVLQLEQPSASVISQRTLIHPFLTFNISIVIANVAKGYEIFCSFQSILSPHERLISTLGHSIYTEYPRTNRK